MPLVVQQAQPAEEKIKNALRIFAELFQPQSSKPQSFFAKQTAVFNASNPESYLTKQAVQFHPLRESMKDASMSEWFSLYTRVIFDHVYTLDARKRDRFSTALSNLRLHGFMQQVKRQKPYPLLADIAALHQKQARLPLQGFFDWRHAVVISKALQAQLQKAEDKLHVILGQYLLVEKIVVYLEKHQKLTAENTRDINKRLNREPMGLILDLVDVLKVLGCLNPDESQSFESKLKYVNGRIEHVIERTLQLIGFKGDNKTLVALIRADLFDKKHLLLIDNPAPAAGAGEKVDPYQELVCDESDSDCSP